MYIMFIVRNISSPSIGLVYKQPNPGATSSRAGPAFLQDDNINNFIEATLEAEQQRRRIAAVVSGFGFRVYSTPAAGLYIAQLRFNKLRTGSYGA